ncbi:MAG: hypothetical protein ABI685_10180, partial [Ferruginibacter sp.]
CMQPSFNNGHIMQIKLSDIRHKTSNSQPCIAAHLQGTQSHSTKANLAKELQLPTHGNQFSIQKVITNLYCIIKHIAGLRENKTKRKKWGAAPPIFSVCKFIQAKK